jgi:uncharacterized RDD family membrane protein YckC
MTSPKDFGWWIESTDEDIYGPVTKKNLTRFLTDGVISPNTGVRHCSEAKFAPAADQGMTENLPGPAKLKSGDTLEENWPKKTKERMALAESDVECAYHRRPAILSCIRCLAPYCSKCQMKKRGKTYLMCKKCQSGITNRRTGAYFLDTFSFVLLPTLGIGYPLMFAIGAEAGVPLVNLISFGGLSLFMFRDPLFGGAGPGKRVFGLKAVKHEDGVSPVTMGQGFVRSLPHLIPFFNLVDASVPNGDPFQRRFGDAWAKTRVIDTDAKVQKIRDKVRQRLEKKGIKMTSIPVTTLSEFAQLG